MRSSAATAGGTGYATDYNYLRADAQAASWLLVHQKSSPGMGVTIEAGVCYIGGTKVSYAGGNSGTITAPVSNPRIDLVTIDSSGTIGITTGTENASPTAPTYPANKVVLAEIYNVTGETIIYDNANQTMGQGYITDVRPFVQSVDPTQSDLSSQSLQTLYTNNTGRAQLHVVTIAITGNNGAATVTATIDGTGGSPVGTTVCEQSVNNPAATALVMEVVLTFLVKVGGTYYIDKAVTGSSSVGSVVAWRAISF